MNDREKTIELIAQTLAPRLFKLCGVPPEEVGFPIYKTKEECDGQLERQFDPVGYWISRGREIAIAIFTILEAGSVALSDLDIDTMCEAAMNERPDAGDTGTGTGTGGEYD